MGSILSNVDSVFFLHLEEVDTESARNLDSKTRKYGHFGCYGLMCDVQKSRRLFWASLDTVSETLCRVSVRRLNLWAGWDCSATCG